MGSENKKRNLLSLPPGAKRQEGSLLLQGIYLRGASEYIETLSNVVGGPPRLELNMFVRTGHSSYIARF